MNMFFLKEKINLSILLGVVILFLTGWDFDNRKRF